MSRLAPKSATAAPNDATGGPQFCDRRGHGAAPGAVSPVSAPVITREMARDVEPDLQAVASVHLVLDAVATPAWAAVGFRKSVERGRCTIHRPPKSWTRPPKSWTRVLLIVDRRNAEPPQRDDSPTTPRALVAQQSAGDLRAQRSRDR